MLYFTDQAFVDADTVTFLEPAAPVATGMIARRRSTARAQAEAAADARLVDQAVLFAFVNKSPYPHEEAEWLADYVTNNTDAVSRATWDQLFVLINNEQLVTNTPDITVHYSNVLTVTLSDGNEVSSAAADAALNDEELLRDDDNDDDGGTVVAAAPQRVVVHHIDTAGGATLANYETGSATATRQRDSYRCAVSGGDWTRLTVPTRLLNREFGYLELIRLYGHARLRICRAYVETTDEIHTAANVAIKAFNTFSLLLAELDFAHPVPLLYPLPELERLTASYATLRGRTDDYVRNFCLAALAHTGSGAEAGAAAESDYTDTALFTIEEDIGD